jgi:hypothetical protein
MKLIFNGVEIPSNRTLLESNGVVHVMLSYWGLRKRGLPKTKPYLIGEHFLPNMKVWVDSGAKQADKANLSKQELEDYAADYEEFISLNYDRIEGWVEFDSQVMGFDWILQQRDVFAEDPKFFVVWHDIYGQNLLIKWGSEYPNIAIPGETIEKITSLAAVVRSIKTHNSTQFMALATAKPDNLRQIPFDMAATLAWISPMRRGETIIWDNTKLVRYPKNMKAQARLRYKTVVEKAGLDFKKFIDDDTLEATKVAIWSYLQLEKKMNNNKDNIVSDNSDDTLYTGLMETGVGASNNSDIEKRKVERQEVVQRDPNEVVPMPVFGYEMKSIVENVNGYDVLREVPVVQSNNSSLRQCDTCFVAANCPAFKPQNTCAFNLPVEVKTKDQLKSLLTAIVEMQGQRVAFMRFAEEMNGGYADPNVSQEIDRLFKLVGSLKELETNKEFIQITASRQTEGGALSRIFGDRASVLRNLEKPLSEDQTTGIIRDAFE